MTWRRINDDTYIDDTLVTCAEYQLFIDEMREQRKYYQPDHWTSLRFPKNQAHKPILGIRISDAEDFCGWLSQRGSDRWFYRLPTDIEAGQYFLNYMPSNETLGYWVINPDENSYKFTWINSISHDDIILNDSRDTSRNVHKDINLNLKLALTLLNELGVSENRLSLILKIKNLYVLRERIAGA